MIHKRPDNTCGVCSSDGEPGGSSIGFDPADFTDARSLNWRPSDFSKPSILESAPPADASAMGFDGHSNLASLPSREQSDGFFPPDANLAIPVDPGKKGPFPVCSSDPSLKFPVKRLDGSTVPTRLVVYAPGNQVAHNQCRSVVDDCPLVVLLHADWKDGNKDAYLEYEDLCKHLASYGYVVASLDRYGAGIFDADDVGQSWHQALLRSFLLWIQNGNLGIVNIITDQLVLIGHSGGGGAVAEVANIVGDEPALASWQLTSIVLMCPSVADPPGYVGRIRSFLGMHVATDTDLGTSGGAPQLNLTFSTTVRAYESAGVLADKNSFNFEKHLLYISAFTADDLDGTKVVSHFFQNEPFARAYVLAFLHFYVRGMQTFSKYFKRQARIASLAPSVRVAHLHEDVVRKVLVDFGSPHQISTGGGIEGFQVGLRQSLDSYALNNIAVAKFRFVSGGASWIQISFSPVSAVGFRWLSVEMCQTHAEGVELRSDISAEVTLKSGKSEGVAVLGKFGYFMRYPRTYIPENLTNLTHTCLQAQMVPLLHFSQQGVNLAQLTDIVLDFSENVSSEKFDVLVGIIKLLK